MPKTTLRSVLPDMGFRLRSSEVDGSRPNIGTSTLHHYSLTRQTVGNGGIVRPITHHFLIHEFSKYPGKYNVNYHVTQGGEPYSAGDFDARRQHAINSRSGVKDPLGDLIEHHRMVSNILDHREAPPLTRATPSNLQHLLPAQNIDQAKMVYHNSARQQRAAWLMDQADRDLLS